MRYADGQIRHSLVRSGNQWVTIENARADTRYDELGNAKARVSAGSAVWQTEAVAGGYGGRQERRPAGRGGAACLPGCAA